MAPLLVLLGHLVAAASASAQPADIEVLGLRRTDESTVRELLGDPPSEGDLDAWAEAGVAAVLEALAERGYPAARGWYLVEEGRRVRVEIDEGRISRIGYLGAGSYDAFLLSDNVMLPSYVLYEPALDESLWMIGERYGLERVPWQVVDGDRYYTTELGLRVPERVLLVRLFEEDEREGFDLDISADSNWGVVTGLEYERGQPWGPRRHLLTGLYVGFPFHEYIFEQDPQIRWVFGALSLAYTFGTFGDSAVAPRLRVASRLPRYERRDLGVAGAIVTHNELDLSVVLRFPEELEQVLGVGLRVIELVAAQPLPGGSTAGLPDEPVVIRPLVRSWTRWTPDDGTLREDLRDFVQVDLHFGANVRESWLFSAIVEDRLAALYHWGALIMTNRIVFLTGDVRFYDEVELDGDYLRTGFDDLYWVREAFQTELAARFTLSSNFDVGVFADGAVFRDRRRPSSGWSLATSFGPSLHAIIVDQFSFDVHYGFGFAPMGFDHSISLHFESFY